mmetsp:Transcript_3985/g.9160  ORF Transcript_3985/g.9160 Transcript_3985/m.9160 type:complete len:364 (+) Transcript_3985:85-1176(+)
MAARRPRVWRAGGSSTQPRAGAGLEDGMAGKVGKAGEAGKAEAAKASKAPPAAAAAAAAAPRKVRTQARRPLPFNPIFCRLRPEGPGPFSEFTDSSMDGEEYEEDIYEEDITKLLDGKSVMLKLEGAALAEVELERLRLCRDQIVDYIGRDANLSIGAQVGCYCAASLQRVESELLAAGAKIRLPGAAEDVELVLVEVCADSRYFAAKLLQIEVWVSLLKEGASVDGNVLQQARVGFAIVFKRAAIQYDPLSIANLNSLNNVAELIEEGRLLTAFCEEVPPVVAKELMQRQHEREMQLKELEEQLQRQQEAAEQLKPRQQERAAQLEELMKQLMQRQQKTEMQLQKVQQQLAEILAILHQSHS